MFGPYAAHTACPCRLCRGFGAGRVAPHEVCTCKQGWSGGGVPTGPRGWEGAWDRDFEGERKRCVPDILNQPTDSVSYMTAYGQPRLRVLRSYTGLVPSLPTRRIIARPATLHSCERDTRRRHCPTSYPRTVPKGTLVPSIYYSAV